MINDLLKGLNIDPVILLLNIVLFITLIQVLSRVFWNPIMKHLEARKFEIAGAYKVVDDTRTEMERLRSEYQDRLAKIEAEARGRIQETVKDAQLQRESLIADARIQADNLMRDGAADIEIERVETLVRMRGKLDSVALNALSKSIGSESTSIQRELVDEYIKSHVARS